MRRRRGPRSRSRRPRPGATARRLARVLAGALTLAAATAVPAAATTGAGAAGRQEPPAGGETQIELVEQSAWLAPDAPYAARVRVVRPPAGAGLRLVVHGRLLSRDDFQQSLDGDLGPVRIEGPTQGLGELQAGGAGTVATGLATDGSVGGVALDQGVYPVEIQVVVGGTPVASLVTHAVVLAPDASDYPPLSVGVVVDVAAPPALRPDGTVEMSADSIARVSERVGLLERSSGVPLTLAPLPETLDGLAGADEPGPDALAEMGAARGGRPVLARPYTDIDLTALRDAGLISEVNTQAHGGAEVIRSRFGVEPLPGIWLSGRTLGGAAAATLVDLGVARAIVPRTAVADAPGLSEDRVPEEPIVLGQGGPVAVVGDPVLASRLAGGQGMLDAHRFLAELAITWLERPAVTRGLAVQLPADVPLDVPVVERALTELAAMPGLRPVTVDQLFAVPPTEGGEPPVAAVADHEVTSELSTVSGRIEAARSRVGGYGDVVGDPAAGLSLEHSLLMATGVTTADAERRPYVDRVTGQIAGLRGVIDAPDEFRITLTSRSTTIPLNLTNRSNQPVRVRIELESDQLEFPDGDVIVTTLEPAGNRLDVRVRTRASGAFPLDITVLSPDRSIELDSTRFDIRSTTVSGVGLVLSIGAGLFLAVWWARHWHGTRRSRRLVPAGTAPAVAAPADADDPPESGVPAPPGGGYHPAHMAGHRSRRR